MKSLRIFDTHNNFTLPSTVPSVTYCVQQEELHWGGAPNTNGVEYVDLGLSNGMLWATKNLGADSPTDQGLLFAWGDTVGHDSSYTFSWDNYKWGAYNRNSSPDYGFTKYNHTDKLSMLQPEDDAAHVLLGGDWQMPRQGYGQLFLNETEVLENTDTYIIFTSGKGTITFPKWTYNGNLEYGLTHLWTNQKYDYSYSSQMYKAFTDWTQMDRYLGQNVRGVIYPNYLNNPIKTVNGYLNTFFYDSFFYSVINWTNTGEDYTTKVTVVLEEPVSERNAIITLSDGLEYPDPEYRYNRPKYSGEATTTDGKTWTATIHRPLNSNWYDESGALYAQLKLYTQNNQLSSIKAWEGNTPVPGPQ